MKIESKKTALKPKVKVHFMGIGGSGISAVAALAKKHGFVVSGCDEQENTPYLDKVRKLGIKTLVGHSDKHLNDYDLLVISPAIVYQNKSNPEYKKGLADGKVEVWNKFVGNYLLADKNVIAVSGTHGKGTTTAMLSLAFENVGIDPNVIIGATVPSWKSNYREGSSDIFIIEADEFYEKFLDYKPSTIIINNIEMDHPDYFKDEQEITSSFTKFIQLLRGDRNLIVNLDSPGVVNLLKKLNKTKGINIYGYTLRTEVEYKVKYLISGHIITKDINGTKFAVYSKELKIDEIFQLSIPGEYNVSNALGVITAAKLFRTDFISLHKTLFSFNGLGRRFEKIYDSKRIVVYDDYAHHPTAVTKTLEALRQRYPTQKIICIYEPHSYSRTKALLEQYKRAFDPADKVIVGPIFKARDIKTYGVNSEKIVRKSGHPDIVSAATMERVVKLAKDQKSPSTVFIVMGAGESYLWTKEIVKLM